MQEEPAQGGKRKAEGEGRGGEDNKKVVIIEEEPKGEKRAMDEWDAMAESLKERAAKRARDMELNKVGEDVSMQEVMEILREEAETYDANTGEAFKKELVKIARADEMETFRRFGVYTKRPTKECWSETGTAPIKVKWVDINKGDTEREEYRSRLVAMEIALNKREDLFAATPPLEAKKMLFSLFASKKKMSLDFIDVSRAYFHAKARRKIYVELPPEDAAEGMCGILEKSMYGTRDAAQSWENEYTDMLADAKFAQGKHSACVFFHAEREVRVVVHGDDFTVLGRSEQLDWFRGVISKRMEVKFRKRLERGKKGSVRILKRIVTSVEDGLEYEADQRHAEIIATETGMTDDSKEVVTPGVSVDDGKNTGEGVDGKLFRALAARCNYMAQDRVDVQFAAKEISRFMSAPEEQD
jgi:hypothetical protein